VRLFFFFYFFLFGETPDKHLYFPEGGYSVCWVSLARAPRVEVCEGGGGCDSGAGPADPIAPFDRNPVSLKKYDCYDTWQADNHKTPCLFKSMSN